MSAKGNTSPSNDSPVAVNKTSPFCGKKVKIIIHKDTNRHAVDPVPVAPEGVQFLIRRGEEVTVPIEVAHALENAEETHYDPVKNQEGRVTMVPRKALSYPFSVVSYVPA